MTLDPRTTRTIRDLVQKQHALERKLDRVNRAQDAGRTTIHRGATQYVDPATGEVTHQISADGLEHVGGEVPPQPAAPVLAPGADYFTVTTDGDDVHGNSAPADWAKTLVYAAMDPDFDVIPAHVQTTLWEPADTANLAGVPGTWYVRIVWVSKSGLRSAPSERVAVEIEPRVDAKDIEDTLAEAERLIDEAAQEAQQRFDELKERLDNFEVFDPTDLEEELADIAQGLTEARQDATEMFEQLEGQVTPQALINKLVAQEAWIGGTILKDDSVQAKHVTASESLSAKIAEFLKLSVVDLIAGTGQIDNAVIQQLWVDGLVGYSATLARAVIAAPNLLPSPDADDAADFWTPISRNTGHPSVWIQGRYTRRSTGTVRLDAGEEYRFKTAVAASVANTRYYIQLVGTGNTPNLYIASNQVAGSSPGDWADFENAFTVAETGDYYINIYANHQNGVVGAENYQWFRTPRIERMLDGRLTVPGTIDVGSLNVTEEMVAAFARILHLVVDQMDVNAFWADQSWLGAAKASSLELEAADGSYINRMSGRGQFLTRKNQDDPNGPEQPLMSFGIDGENMWATFDPTTGETLASISADGAGSFQMLDSATDPTVMNRRLVGGLVNHPASQYSQSILDSIGWGEPSYVSTVPAQGPHAAGEVGLLQANFTAYPGRRYQIIAEAGHLIQNGQTIRVNLRYTTNGLDPDAGSTLLDHAAIGGGGGWGPLTVTGRIAGPTDVEHGQPVPIRVLLSYDSSAPWSFVGGTGYRDLSIQVLDVGPIRPQSGYARNVRSTTGGTPPGVTAYSSAWPASVMANYRNQGSIRRTGGTASLYAMQGYDPHNTNFGSQGSLLWFNQATQGEIGATIPAAMAGATLESGSLDVFGDYIPGHLSVRARAYWHEYPTAPDTMGVYEPHLIGEFHVPRGGRGKIQLPQACLTAIKNGTFAGIAFYTSDRSLRYALGISWQYKPNLILNYQR